ncbi:MAG TPA: DEAD/DEAH box helicase, partial [Lacunisphaera sp.]|nr:DEAD/DEAH box helicase [Lacunisphaera sp.]
MPFAKLGLPPALIHGVKAMGYTDPTPIQLRAIPVVLGGGDLIGSAQTGTGKTAAFALPILARLGKHEARGPRVLIL